MCAHKQPSIEHNLAQKGLAQANI